MNRELQNMSEKSLQSLEEIVETEFLTVEDIWEQLDITEKGENSSVHSKLQICIGA